MASGLKTLRVRITGDSVSAQKALSDLQHKSGQATSGLGRVSAGSAAVGVGMAAVATGIVAFGKSSVDALKDVNSQSVMLQKVMGGSIEDASRMRYAASVLGVDTESLARGMTFLSKNIAGNSKDWKKLGIDAKDAHGNIKPMSALLPEIIDKLSKMPNGIEKTALMTKLFGKGWKDLTPILNGGGAQLKSLEAESDSLGLTLDKNTQGSIKKQAIEQRKLSEAWKGLKVTIGTELMPVLISFTNYLIKNVVPVIKDVIKWMKEHKTTMHLLVAVLGPLTVASLALGATMRIFGPLFMVLRPLIMGVTVAMRALNLAFLMNPIVLIIVAIIALVAGFIYLWKNCEAFRNFWKAMWHDIQNFALAVWNWLKANWKTVIMVMLSITTGGLFFLLNHWRAIWNGLKTAFANTVNWFRGGFDAFVRLIESIPRKIENIFAGVWDGLKNGFKAVINWIIDGINEMIRAYTDTVGQLPGTPDISEIPHLARGGLATRSGMALVGEKGPELLNLPGGASVIPLPRGGGAGGATYNVTVNVAGHVRTEQDLVTAIRDGILRIGKRNGGRVGLA